MRTTKLVTISIMPELLEQAEAMAKEEHRTKSELFREALRNYIEEREWQYLSRYGHKKAQELGIKNEDDVASLIDEYHNEHTECLK
ncbi:MAG: ribbon-helix-helix protein, CopG family [Nitrospirae bacterium]|nr:ribbon-helix-helix protein, CopG family [Nitrospirota bacterium]